MILFHASCNDIVHWEEDPLLGTFNEKHAVPETTEPVVIGYLATLNKTASSKLHFCRTWVFLYCILLNTNYMLTPSWRITKYFKLLKALNILQVRKLLISVFNGFPESICSWKNCLSWMFYRPQLRNMEMRPCCSLYSSHEPARSSVSADKLWETNSKIFSYQCQATTRQQREPEQLLGIIGDFHMFFFFYTEGAITVVI